MTNSMPSRGFTPISSKTHSTTHQPSGKFKSFKNFVIPTSFNFTMSFATKTTLKYYWSMCRMALCIRNWKNMKGCQSTWQKATWRKYWRQSNIFTPLQTLFSIETSNLKIFSLTKTIMWSFVILDLQIWFSPTTKGCLTSAPLFIWPQKSNKTCLTMNPSICGVSASWSMSY